ncbi:urease accessory protein UreE [Oceanobacillus sp. FSL K6-2867]|uniref:urease accessory protein UreE n=1 Tax=Oceanobacillus sp. FSL K6-2867 TaxID=2954748 RepID=UPI0030D73235
MFCNEILGNSFEDGLSLDNEELNGFETIELEWDECAKQILRKETNLGREIGISLSHQPSLRHGDILIRDNENTVAVYVKPCKVLVISPQSTKELGLVCYELGNRHLPLEVTNDGKVILLPDDPTELLLDKLHVKYEKQTRRFQPIPKGGRHHHHQHQH